MKAITILIVLFLALAACQKEKIPGYEQYLEFYNHTPYHLTVYLYSGTGMSLEPYGNETYDNNGLLPNVWQTEYTVRLDSLDFDHIYMKGVVKGKNDIPKY